jgi:kinesin family protein C1
MIDGYHVLIGAYGRTGSGKTFTMEGGSEDIDEGLVPRAIRQLFTTLGSIQNFRFHVSCYMVQFHLNNVRDCLNQDA